MTNIGYTPEEPIAAIATALAPGAIGIVRASGKNSIELVSKVFSRPKSLLEAAGNTLVYGWMQQDKAHPVDEVMLGVYRNPKSFTGEDMVEIFCHGGVRVVNAVLALLLDNGFRQAEKGEFTFRAYINGKADLTKAEAVREIIDSKTEISRGRAAGRLAGSLFEEIDQIKKLVVDTLAEIEVGIEYPEDEETIADSFNPQGLVEAKSRLDSLSRSWKSEKLYQDGARVVLAGKTNAGKSSLFNALLKEERAIVSDIEGTTRDWLESWVSFEGIPARLFDTAGLRKTDDVIEARGVELTKDLSQEADLILYLVDSRYGLTPSDLQFMAGQKEVPVVLVWNKCDEENSMALASCSRECTEEDKLLARNKCWKKEAAISAKKGMGIGELCSAVKEILFDSNQTDNHSTVALGSERQKKSIDEALERVAHAIEIGASGEYGLDAVVQDLEDSLDSLGEVTGEVTPDDILGSIFSHFCVGK